MAVRYTSPVFLTDEILDKSYRANGSRVIAIHNDIQNVPTHNRIVCVRTMRNEIMTHRTLPLG